MSYLTEQDWRTLVSALDILHADFDPQTLTERTLTAIAKVIPAADSAAFTGFRQTGEYADLMWDNGGGFSAAEMEIFAAFIHENPLFEEYLVKHRTDALKITDLISKEEFERTTIYNEFYRRVGVGNQLVKPMNISEDLMITCSLNIENRDFSERDKEILTVIEPHLANAIRNAFAYRNLSAPLETETSGVVILNSKDNPLFISRFAHQIFQKYFAGEGGTSNSLPETLAGWVGKMHSTALPNEFAAPVAPLKIVVRRDTLTIRLAFNKQSGEKTLMLEEKRFVSPATLARFGVTRREAEILFFITQGKSDEIIARLCGISPRTVHKHLQNIYTKLGVETRAAAMLKVLEIH